ncbi:DUF1796 family putative cysteine peptidase [Cohnella candidum]|uniref:Peptidase n=1 Tax=Cohnella candidum TaxID=2674991 RepID=A0A3G3JX40_9BACL|nr:DUF1796 family putative cysteine peptidase [Cohnella candidum]AYQ72813.1 hypothetical protein EAV92_09710 [Cohnella candidum]
MAYSAGGYKTVISLGSTCQTAYQLQRLGLRKFSGPLDWFVTESMDGMVRLISHRFAGFMELPRLEVIDATGECFVVRDKAYDVLSFHDFPLHHTIERWWDAYPAFKQTLNRRVSRFLQTVPQQGPILFVRTGTERHDAIRLQAALRTLTNAKFHLLIVNHHQNDRWDVAYENWGIDGILAVRMPKGADWRGSNEAWNQCLYAINR